MKRHSGQQQHKPRRAPTVSTATTPTPSSPASATSPSTGKADTRYVAEHWMASVAELTQHDGPDGDDPQRLVLHVLRILAIALYVLLSQHTVSTKLIFPAATTALVDRARRIERQVHATLLACVQGELASNQFDGMIREKRVFAAIRRVFRQQQVKTELQAQILSRLLAAYLHELHGAPIVRCDPVGMLASTLEYLSHGEQLSISPSLLYPLVNAIDSLSIEQRECLDALATLWKWLAMADSTHDVLESIIRQHRSEIFQIDNGHQTKADSVSLHSNEDLAKCFVRTLVHHADHIFRHDLEFAGPEEFFESDTDVEDGGDVSDDPTECEDPLVLPPSPCAMSKENCGLIHNTTDPVVVGRQGPLGNQDRKLVIDAHEPMPSAVRVGIAAAASTLAAAVVCVIFT